MTEAAEYEIFAGVERNYTMLYSPEKYAALWVAYPLAKGHMSTGRQGDWDYFPTDRIPASDQVNITGKNTYGVNYAEGNAYARGHQIPNADRNADVTMQAQTYYVTNSTPQIQNGFNGGIWSSLETAVRGAVPASDTLYVVTGPVYQPEAGESVAFITPKSDSGKLVPVPTHYFKAVLKVRRDSGGAVTGASAIGFWLKHRVYSGDSYVNYAVSVDEIERKTGFDLFANLPDTVEAAAEANGSWTDFLSF